jgi:hypothetical protein
VRFPLKFRAVIGLAIGVVFSGGTAHAQESSSNPAAASASASSPMSALRDILKAACSQSQADFARFLTARNAEAFDRMTAAARVAFMKRFVLLNQVGRASVTTSPVGRPIVRCETAAGAAEIQIGGADARDNIAFMPVELRDATDSSGASAIQVNMGLVREGGEWKILSLGLVLLDLPSLELEWDSAEVEKNEQAAIESLKTIAEAVESYRRTYARLPESLSNLGPPLRGAASAQAAGLVDADLSTGIKNGYSFRYVIAGGSAIGAPAKFALSATPVSYGRTGRRSFFWDTAGTLRGADHKGVVGSDTDPKLP